MGDNEQIRYRLFDIPLEKRDLCFFDLESTRLDLKGEIVEIGALRVDPKEFNILKELELKIKPQKIGEADSEALAVAGYNEGEWQDAVDLEAGVKRFLEFTDGAILVANNLPFDWMWLQKALEDLTLAPTYFFKGLDIFSLAWLYFKKDSPLNTLSLKELANHFNIDMGKQHCAVDDARTAYQVFLKLVEK